MAERSLLGALYQTGRTLWNQRNALRRACPACGAKPHQPCDTTRDDPPIRTHQERVDLGLGLRCESCGYVKHERVVLIPQGRCPSCGYPM